MKTYIFSLMILSLSWNAAAELTAVNADGWEMKNVANDKFVQMVLPGAEFAMTREAKDGKADSDGVGLSIRKVGKVSADTLKEDGKAWLSAIYGAEKMKKISSSAERQHAIKVDGQWRFIAEVDYRSGVETPLHVALLSLNVGEDLYLVMFEQRGGKIFNDNKKAVLELFKKLKLENAP